MKKLIPILALLLGLLLVMLIVNSTKLVNVQGQRDRLSETDLQLVKVQLGDVSAFLSKLANGPSGPGDNELGDLVWVSKQALFIKHSGIYNVYDESPGFRAAGYQFSGALEELQLVLYNLERRMTKYHYKLNEEDRKRAQELSKAVYELQQSLKPLQGAAYRTDDEAVTAINAYKEKAEIVAKQSREFVAILIKE